MSNTKAQDRALSKALEKIQLKDDDEDEEDSGEGACASHIQCVPCEPSVSHML